MRPRGGRAVIVCGLVLLLTGARVAAQSALLPSDDKDRWILGLARLFEEELSPASRYLTRSIPLLLYESLVGVDRHPLPEAELAAYRESLLAGARRAAAAELAAALRRRDDVLFSTGTREEREARLASLDEEVQSARDRALGLNTASASAVSVEAVKALAFWEGHEEGRLLEPSDRSRPEAGVSPEVDYILWGELEEIEGYVFTDLYLTSRLRDETIFTYSDAARADEFHIIVADAVYEIARFLLDREHGSIAVTSPVPEARIEIDGQTVGFGSASVSFLPTGTREVRVSAQGRRDVLRRVVLEARDELVVAADPSPIESRQVQIITDPPGALVHLGSLPRGRSPLSLDRPALRSALSLSLDGYEDVLVPLAPDGPGTLSFDLVPAVIDWEQELLDRRNRFYDSLAVFLLSVPVPVLTGGLYQSVATVFPQDLGASGLTPEQLNRLAVEGNLLYVASVGTAILSGFFLINAVLDALEYVDAARRVSP